MRAPTRIDFGGGWTDVPPYSEIEGGFVCNVAIDRYATVTIGPAASRDGAAIATDRAADRSIIQAARLRAGVAGVNIILQNDFPIGAGLGGSSAAGVATVAALAAWGGHHLHPADLAERSREIEIGDLGIPGGRQDHYAAVFGGALALRFTTSVEIQRIPLAPALRRTLEQRCVLVYTGQSRISGDTITAVLDAYRDRNVRVLFALKRMKELAQQMAEVLASGFADVDALAALVGEHWAHQRSLHVAIPTPRIDEIIKAARRAGARGAKALGASGGGCVLVIAGHESVDQVRDAVRPLGTLLPFAIDDRGVTTCG